MVVKRMIWAQPFHHYRAHTEDAHSFHTWGESFPNRCYWSYSWGYGGYWRSQ